LCREVTNAALEAPLFEQGKTFEFLSFFVQNISGM
jgi:hypothetical protein